MDRLPYLRKTISILKILYGGIPCELDIKVFRAATQGFPKPMNPTSLVCNEIHYDKCNAKTKGTLFKVRTRKPVTIDMLFSATIESFEREERERSSKQQDLSEKRLSRGRNYTLFVW